MEFLRKMNELLDQGWKMTDASCPICKGNILLNPKGKKELYCIKCAMPVKIEIS